LKQATQIRADFVRDVFKPREAARFAEAAIFGRRRRRRRHRASRGAADIGESILFREGDERQRIDDTAGDPALHDDVADFVWMLEGAFLGIHKRILHQIGRQ
jgi:hypothetical protein